MHDVFLNVQAMPHSEEAEKSVIGLTLVEKRIPQPARELATTDFYNKYHRALWSAIIELDENGAEIDPIAAASIVKRDNALLADNLGVVEITQITRGIVAGFNPANYVLKIKQLAARRYLMKELEKQIKAIADDTDSDAIGNLKRKLSDVETHVTGKNSFTLLADILEREVKPALADLRQGITHRISTGFEAIDKEIGGGLSSSDVILVAALPGGGKSAFVLQVAVNIAKQNIPVAFLSGEMSNRENALRLLSQAAQFFNLNAATYLNESAHERLLQWVEALKVLPIYFDAKTSDLQTISKNVRALVENHGIKVLVVDYIQLLKLSKFDKQTRFERISECSQEIKRLAMELEIAVIEVAQFNREGAKSGKPKLHDLDGASQLEKDISLCFIIDRDEQTDAITLRIEKGRNTGKCSIEGRFTGMNLNFEF